MMTTTYLTIVAQTTNFDKPLTFVWADTTENGIFFYLLTDPTLNYQIFIEIGMTYTNKSDLIIHCHTMNVVTFTTSKVSANYTRKFFAIVISRKTLHTRIGRPWNSSFYSWATQSIISMS
jgi:hypothetical protein